MPDNPKIVAVDVWQIRIPLARSYHLSPVLGTMTHSQGFIVRLALENGILGWGEGNPQFDFDGHTQESAHSQIVDGARAIIGRNVEDLTTKGFGAALQGASAAALDIACFDALGKTRNVPVWRLLGDRVREEIDVLWPTSNGKASEDLEIIRARHPEGFRTYMLKMGSQSIAAEIDRTREVIGALPDGVRIMVDANQGWDREQALDYVQGCNDLPVILVEQPLRSDDIDGLGALRKDSELPISVDESVSTLAQAREVVAKDAADIFSIKVSKNGGLSSSKKIADLVASAGKKVLMNSMIELGICQAASLQLAATLDNLLPCGHAYMSTLRMADDVTNFSNRVKAGRVTVPDLPGLGIDVSIDKIKQYQFDHIQLS